MAVLTASPEADPAVTACDGYVTQIAMPSDTWANMRAGTPGLGTRNADTAGIVSRISTQAVPDWSTFDRTILCFDTSALTGAATVTGAMLSVYVEAYVTDALSTDGISLTQVAPAAYDTLVGDDYITVTDTIIAPDFPLSSFPPLPGYLTFILNADGLAWINRFGVTAVALRTLADANNNELLAGSTIITITSADAGADVPVLTVIYTLGGSSGTPYYITKKFKALHTVYGEEPFSL